VLDRTAVALLARCQQRSPRFEEALGLGPGQLEDLVDVKRRRDRAERGDERLEEARLAGELLLDDLVPAPLAREQLGDDQDACEARDPDPDEGPDLASGEQCDERGAGGEQEGAEQRSLNR
jgi:hypothetical protein